MPGRTGSRLRYMVERHPAADYAPSGGGCIVLAFAAVVAVAVLAALLLALEATH